MIKGLNSRPPTATPINRMAPSGPLKAAPVMTLASEIGKAGRTVAGITIKKGERPAGRIQVREKYRPVHDAASALQPGEWFEWKDAPVNACAMIRKWAEKGLKIRTYREAGTTRIVAHQDGGEDFIED